MIRKTTARTVVPLAALLATTLAGTSQASADSVAMTRCETNGAPDVSGYLTLTDHQSTSQTTDHNVWSGDVYRITARGTMHTSALPWDDYDPNGRTGDPAPFGDAAWPGPGLTKFSLVGGYNATATEQFGTDTACFTVPSTVGHGDLHVWINDNVTADNSGRWEIWYQQYYG